MDQTLPGNIAPAKPEAPRLPEGAPLPPGGAPVHRAKSGLHRETSNQAFVPPSTVRFAPVMYEDSGPATNATSAATSSTSP
jgi:hypothetical protein